jgi:hypothetical protein
MDSEEYEGWSNRETWAFALWVDNDQGLHDQKNHIIWRCHSECSSERYCADAIKEWANDELFNRDSDGTIMNTDLGRTMRDEVGSLWRVNWGELASHWLADIEETA